MTTKAMHSAHATRRSTAVRTAATILLGAAVLGSCSSPTQGPDTSAPASVTVAPSTALLVSVGDTIDLTATVRNAASQAISTAPTWSVAPAGVVTVDATGRAVAVGNGEATVTASAGSASGSATVTVEQVVDSVEAAGDAQAADVGAPLDSAIVLTLFDARGNPVAGAPASFAVASGGGAVSSSTATTDEDGSAAATWTLGTGSGLQELDVTAGFQTESSYRFTATAYPLEARTLASFGGDGQSELALSDLAAPLQVQVLDSLGNGVPDVLVSFTVDGDAALEEPEVYTDLDGVASVGLTLGSALGAYTITATVADSLTVTGEPLDGSPVSLGAEAVAYSVAPVTELVVGDTITLAGTGFHPTLASNSVVLGGAAATLLEGSQTELTIEVPSFGCTPQRGMDLDVSRAGEQVVQPVTVTPAGALSLAVGERRVLSEDDAFCLQFLPDTNDEYLVGLTSTAWFDGGATFAATGLDSTGPFPTPPAPTGASLDRGISTWTSLRATDAAFGGSESLLVGAERQLREQERTLLSRLSLSGTPSLSPALPSGAPPMEGDQLQLRLPDLRGDPCLDYVPVAAEVFSVGARLALATSAAGLLDPANPFLFMLIDAANLLHAEFGDTGINLIMGFLGAPAGWDADSRVTVVLTPDVGLMGVPAYASAVDQLPRTTCPSSDEGHYVYVDIPDAATMAELAAVVAASPSELTHHVSHVVQWTRRIATGGNLLPSWLAEGQAELIVEHVGLTLSGLGSQQDLGAAVLGLPGIDAWIPPRFDRLALFQGWDGGAGTVAGAPEQCSLFGFGGASSPCDPAAAPGAAWSFLRYLSDRYGPAMAGGEPTLHHALIDLEPTDDLVAQVEELLDATLPELMVDWAAMLYADGRLSPAVAPELQLTSWKLDEMIPAGPKRLAPATFGFADFAREGTVVGGGTAYTLVTSAGAHGSLALAVDDGAGGAIAPVLRPRLWVVRMR